MAVSRTFGWTLDLGRPKVTSHRAKTTRPSHVDLFVQKQLSHSTGGWGGRLGRADRRGVSRHYCCGPRTCCRGWTACPRHCRRRPLAFPQAPQPSLVGLRALCAPRRDERKFSFSLGSAKKHRLFRPTVASQVNSRWRRQRRGRASEALLLQFCLEAASKNTKKPRGASADLRKSFHRR